MVRAVFPTPPSPNTTSLYNTIRPAIMTTAARLRRRKVEDRGMEGEERGGSATRLEVMSRGVDKTSSRAERMESEERGGGGLREVRAVTSNCRAREEFSSSKSSSRTVAEQ